MTLDHVAAGRGETDRARGAIVAADHVEALLTHDESLQVVVTRPHALVVIASRAADATNGRTRERLTVAFASGAVWERSRDLFAPLTARLADGTALLVLVGKPADGSLTKAADLGIASVVPEDPSADEIVLAAARAFELLEAKSRAEARGHWLRRYRFELGELIDIARAMTTVRDVDQLLGVILEKSRFVTGADAGAIYIVESLGPQPMLRFKLTQNDSVKFDSREFTMPLSDRSMAGCAAVRKTAINIADVYDLPQGSTFHFDPSFDRRTGYVTRSMLVAPLVSQRGEVIGVIQLINKKLNAGHKLTTSADVEREVVAFDERSESLLGMLAAQAGVSLETAMLYEEIQSLFDGFVKASVEAIEARDPTTSGHSRRVADFTVELAKVVAMETTGPYADARFSSEDLRELEYASLLHDFGKIGVREKVLVKAKKLYPEQLDLLRARFDYVVSSLEANGLARKLRLLESGALRESLDAIDRELLERRMALEGAWQCVCNANEPSVLSSGDFATIEDLGKQTFVDRSGDVRPLLQEIEVECLKVNRGSLTAQEFDEIRSHVSHTYRFLSRIPWGKALRRVPLIAGSHHEWLNGNGYPNRLHAEEIPVQSKMMSIADVYDALTASDRPYKKAVPIERAIDILGFGVRDGHLDSELVRIFKDARVWERVAAPRS